MKLQGSTTMRQYLILSIILSLFLTGLSHADTKVSGNITTDTTWTLANSPFIVTGTVQVLAGATLTIEPGVTVKFDKDTLLRVGGELVAEGTENQMITLTSNETNPSAGDWGPIEFVEGSVGTTLDEDGEYESGSILKYCQIEYSNRIDSDVDLYISDSTISSTKWDVQH